MIPIGHGGQELICLFFFFQIDMKNILGNGSTCSNSLFEIIIEAFQRWDFLDIGLSDLDQLKLNEAKALGEFPSV